MIPYFGFYQKQKLERNDRQGDIHP